MLIHSVTLAPGGEVAMGPVAALAKLLSNLCERLTNAEGGLDVDWRARSVLHKNEPLDSELTAFAGWQRLEPMQVEVLPFVGSFAHLMRRVLDARIEVVGITATPFFTTKVNSPLSGLGLPAAVGFAMQSGGSMSISCALGRGTSITLKLPMFERPGAGVSAVEGGGSAGVGTPLPAA